MKRFYCLLLISVLSISLILNGCATAPQTANDKEAPEEVEEVIELKFHYFGSDMVPPGRFSKEAAKRIEEQTNGKVRIDTYFSQTLLSTADTVPGTASGVADISLVNPALVAEQYYLNQVFGLIVAEASPQEVLNRSYRELIEVVPELNIELEEKGVRWLSLFSSPGSHLHTTKKEVRVPEDVRGMKICVLGDPTFLFESLGAAPLQIQPGDWYMSLERGLVDGIFLHWAAMDAYKLVDIVDCHTFFGESGAALNFMGYIINNDTWKRLSPEIQEIMVDAYHWAGDQIIAINKEEVTRGIESAKAKGNTFIELTPDELNMWDKYMEPINENWIEKTEAKGWPARETYKELMRLLQEYQ